jgi:hypothetical protein
MCAVEVSLFDVSKGALVPVEQGSVIWVRAEIPDRDEWESLPVSAVRSPIVFELLHRMLEYEGLSGRFVLEPLSGECTMLKAFGELEPREERRLYDDPGGRRFSAYGKRGERRIEMLLPAGDSLEPSSSARDSAATGVSGAGLAAEGAAVAHTTVGEVVSGHGRPALLMHLLSAHYSHPLGDLPSGLREASARVDRVCEVAAMLDAHSPGPVDMDDHMRAFRIALARDLDTPTALRVMFEWLRDAELRPDRIGDSHLQEMLALLSLDELLDEQSAENTASGDHEGEDGAAFSDGAG